VDMLVELQRFERTGQVTDAAGRFINRYDLYLSRVLDTISLMQGLGFLTLLSVALFAFAVGGLGKDTHWTLSFEIPAMYWIFFESFFIVFQWMA
jgi:hypothetical protein